MITLDPQIKTAMVVHAQNCHPEESCGLIAGTSDGDVTMAYPLTNALHSSTNYTIEPREHFRALRHAERLGWDIVGVFHSHPHSPAYPSPTDVRLAPDPGWLYVLVSLEVRDHPDIRGFRIVGGQVHEERLTFEERTPA